LDESWKDYYWDENGHIDSCLEDQDGIPLKYDLLEKTIEKKVDGKFHVGSMGQDPAKSIVCRKCGSTQFNVGQGSYFTAIKCVKCEWEICIHDG
jgi:ribosomal protein L37E